jgi:magnesium chelatase family protein
MTNSDIKRLSRLQPNALAYLNDSARGAQLSARVYMRTIKVARTIADIDNSPTIKLSHISEALHYRYRRPPKDPA